MRDDEMTTLWLGATRYYLGRMTGAVGDFCGMLIRAWPALPEETKNIIQRDIEREFISDDAIRNEFIPSKEQNYRYLPLGHDCDREHWERVRKLWI